MSAQNAHVVTGLMATVELLAENTVPRRLTGPRGTRHAKNNRVVGESAEGTRLDRRGSDFLIGKKSKKLAKSLDLLIEQGRHGFGCRIPPGKSSTTGHQHSSDVGIGNPSRDHSTNLVNVILNNLPLNQLVTR